MTGRWEIADTGASSTTDLDLVYAESTPDTAASAASSAAVPIDAR